MIYRAMKSGDIPAGLTLCRSAGWNQLSRDWEIFITLDPQGNKVCVLDEGAVIGTVTTIRYETSFSWIGMVLVDPEHRRKGIGLKLLQEALKMLQGETCVKLDATPDGRLVYTKLGFKDEYGLSRMSSNSVRVQGLISSPTATTLTADDLERVSNLDRQIFGARRNILLSWMLDGSPELAFKINKGDQLEGYCFGRQGHRFAHIGPVVAANIEIAKDLVSAALKHCENRPVILDISYHNPTWRSWLESIGFSDLRPFIRMFRGSNLHPGTPENQFAILGPEFG